MEQKVTLTLDIPEGYEATGEFREAKNGELWLNKDNQAVEAGGETWSKHPILRRKKKRVVVVEFDEAEMPNPKDYEPSPHVTSLYGRVAEFIWKSQKDRFSVRFEER